MATFTGAAGLKALRSKVRQKSQKLVADSVVALTTHLVDTSPVGATFYPSRNGGVDNDAGDYKNGWSIGLGKPSLTIRPADTTGSGAIADAIAKSQTYQLQEQVFITNNTDHADNVEHGWTDNPVHGWRAKDGYHVVRDAEPLAVGILMSAALKTSLL